ncbi:MAG: hypothetical protein H6502_01360 [Candidatus Woesearchaeota archaeon]|nr:MAG: hypothetical protein H6502_01360 [Candidatus Woesearchaeota archaeon]
MARNISKKGFIPIGTLFLLITMLLIITFVISSVAMKTKALEQDSFNIAKKTKEHSSKYIQVLQIFAEDGRDRTYNTIMIDMKLFGDSSPLKLSDVFLILSSDSGDAHVQLRENSQINNSVTGYLTLEDEELGLLENYQTMSDVFTTSLDDASNHTTGFDLDDDGTIDNMTIWNASHLAFYQSSDATDTPVFAALMNDSGDLLDLGVFPQTISITKQPVGSIGYFSIYGTTGAGNTIGVNGERFFTFKSMTELKNDFDDDGQVDLVAVNATHVIFQLSSLPSEMNFAHGGNLSTGAQTLDAEETIQYEGTRYADVTLSGDTTAANQIDASVTFTVSPTRLGRGFYAIEYLKRDDRWQQDMLNRGDIIRVYLEPVDTIGEEEDLSLRIIHPNIGPIFKDFYSGEIVPNQQRAQLWPAIISNN